MVAVRQRLGDPVRGMLVIALVATLSLLLGYGVVAAVDAFRLDPIELHEALSRGPVVVHPPDGYRFWMIDVPRDWSEDSSGNVALLFREDHRSSRYGGAPLVIQYFVMRSPEAARASFDRGVAGRRQANRGPGPLYFKQWTLPWLEQEHSCVRRLADRETYCQVVVDSVVVEALSRTTTLRIDDATHIDWLTRTAVDHLQEVAASSSLP